MARYHIVTETGIVRAETNDFALAVDAAKRAAEQTHSPVRVMGQRFCDDSEIVKGRVPPFNSELYVAQP